MIRVAWWTCALLAIADSRIYERCELARDLQRLGVQQDHIATWVCIAYHESRFDTAANNPYSGDHGLFQISELYWCGPGKACGLSCSVLRDDDISDDLECALQVYEEHTRLQGNGFLAWVVYPQHCKHNTKKYLVDCDNHLKNTTEVSQSRSFKTQNNYYKTNANYVNNPNIDQLLPPYLTISSIFRANYGKVFDPNKLYKIDWFNYKYDNVDELKLPVFDNKSDKTTPFTTMITSTTTFIPSIMPWRRIETNQFRKKSLVAAKTTASPNTRNDYSFDFDKLTFRPTTIDTTTVESTTFKSVTTSEELSKVKNATFLHVSPKFTSTMKPQNLTTFTLKPSTSTTSYRPPSKSTFKPPIATSTYKYPTFSSTFHQSKSTKDTSSKTPTVSTATYKLSLRTSTTQKPTILTSTTKLPTTSPHVSSTTTAGSTFASVTTTSSKPTTTYLPWYTFTSRYFSTPTTTKIPRYPQISSAKSTTLSSTTSPNTSTVTTQKSQMQTTQSIFGFYLNPTKKPKLSTYKFDSSGDNHFKLKIFSGGTTTPVPSMKNTTRDSKVTFGD